ncbi:MAG: hypothetical protein LBG97_09415 [Coriobacteriales bacterium]|jgi:hypothetical protein|nr:hypothetical protein [Coriobacteriales bacterium]
MFINQSAMHNLLATDSAMSEGVLLNPSLTVYVATVLTVLLICSYIVLFFVYWRYRKTLGNACDDINDEKNYPKEESWFAKRFGRKSSSSFSGDNYFSAIETPQEFTRACSLYNTEVVAVPESTGIKESHERQAPVMRENIQKIYTPKLKSVYMPKHAKVPQIQQLEQEQNAQQGDVMLRKIS